MSDQISRLRTVAEILKQGGTMRVGDVRLGTAEHNEFTVTGWTQCRSVEKLTQSKALEELGEVKKIFEEILNASSEIREFARQKTVGYYLGQDYGQGAIGICKEIEGHLTWEVELKE